jgi:hypothetical protein
MQLWAENILFYCSNTQHVSGALTPIIRSTKTVVTATGTVLIPQRWESYTGKTVKNNLEPAATTCQRVTLACGSCRFKFIFNGFYLLQLPSLRYQNHTCDCNYSSCTPDDGRKHTQNMLSVIAVK